MSESYNMITKLLCSLENKESTKNKQRKKLSKPPSNWSGFGIIKYLKANPDAIGNPAFERPLLDDFYNAVQYASEVKKASWPEFDKGYIVPVKTISWGFSSLGKYFEHAYDENNYSETINKSTDRKLAKFNKVIETCSKNQKWFEVIFESDNLRKITFEAAKTIPYLTATKDKARIAAVKDILVAAWKLVNDKIKLHNVTKEQYEAYRISDRYRTGPEEHKAAKQYVELLKTSFRFVTELDNVFLEYDKRVTENIGVYLKGSVKFLAKDTDFTSYSSKATTDLGNNIKQTYKTKMPPEAVDVYEKEPKLWMDYASIALELEHKIEDTTLDSMAMYVAELIKENSQNETDWYRTRHIFSRINDFFKYIAKYNKRYATIENAFLQKENVLVAREYVDAFNAVKKAT